MNCTIDPSGDLNAVYQREVAGRRNQADSILPISGVNTKRAVLRAIDEWLRDKRKGEKILAHWQRTRLREVTRAKQLQQIRGRLSKLLESLYQQGPDGICPADFRNRIIHSVADDQAIDNAVRICCDQELWAQGAEVQKASFLDGSTLPAKVLYSFGVPDARNFYSKLIAALAADVDAAPLPNQNSLP